nr:ATP phosphoribosyltransferase [Granulicoccus phenolivorans]
MTERPVLKIAVPNKGSLAEASAQMLREAGYRQRSDSKDLVLADPANHVEFYYLRPRDIAVYVGEGTLDVGLTGRDMLLDSGAPAVEIMELGFGATRFRWAGPKDQTFRVADLGSLRIATSYPGLVRAYLAEQGIEGARLIKLDGAVESAIKLGVADVIADVVETGRTLRQAGLELFGDPIMHSEAIVIRRADHEPEGLELLKHRLSGVLVARNYVMMDYDCPSDLVDQASRITPGLESPTVSPLAKQGWNAVRAMVPRRDAHSVMDDLWQLGARAILVTDIAACRL